MVRICVHSDRSESITEIKMYGSKSSVQLGDDWVRSGQEASSTTKSKLLYGSTTWPTRQATESQKFWNPELPPKASPTGRVMLIPFKCGQWSCPGQARDRRQRKLVPSCPCCPNSPSCKQFHFRLIIQALHQQRPYCQEDMGAVLSRSQSVTGGHLSFLWGHLSCCHQSLESSYVVHPGFSKMFGSEYSFLSSYSWIRI